MTLMEVLIASAIMVNVVVGIMSFAFYAARSFAALSNYTALDVGSRSALDLMSTEIRQADKLTAATATTLQFQTTDPPPSTATHTLQYVYSADTQQLTRILDGQSKVLLTQCTYLQFGIFQRNTTPSFTDAFSPVATSRPDLCKVVQLTWICSRNILGRTANTESVQSAKVVIRKK